MDGQSRISAIGLNGLALVLHKGRKNTLPPQEQSIKVVVPDQICSKFSPPGN